MRIKFLFVFLVSIINLRNIDAAEHSKNEAIYSLKFTWWSSPEINETFYIRDTSGKQIGVNPGVMSFTDSLEYSGEPTLTLNKKIISKDSEGKPVITYQAVATIDLEKAGSKEIGVILISNTKSNSVYYQLLNLNEQELPYGSFYLVNFSKARIAASLNGVVIKAEPGQKARSAPFNGRTIVTMAIEAQNGESKPVSIANSQIVLNNTFRSLYFIGEKNSGDTVAYIVKTILDPSHNSGNTGIKVTKEKKKEDKYSEKNTGK